MGNKIQKDETPRLNAARNGQSTYFTGRPCKYGHVVARITKTGACTECRKQSQKVQNEKIASLLRAAREQTKKGAQR